jgi:Leucine-rich repeat (LRR) protein
MSLKSNRFLPSVQVLLLIGALQFTGCQTNSEAIRGLQSRGVTVNRNLQDEVTAVRFGEVQISDADLAAVIGMSGLKELAGDASQLSTASLKKISALSSLEVLHLTNLQDVTVITDSLKNLAALKDLDLSGAKGPVDDCLSAINGMARLESLSLSGTTFSDTSAALLSSGKSAGAMKTLKLSGTHVTDTGIPKIAGSFPSLEQLTLDNCNISAAGVSAMSSLSRLTHLSLHNCQLDDSALAAIGKLTSLRVLDLGDNPGLTDEGVLSLGSLPDLVNLDVSQSGLTGIGFNKAGFRKLASLVADGTKVTDAAIPDFQISTLYSLRLRETSVSEAAVREVFPTNHQTAVAF